MKKGAMWKRKIGLAIISIFILLSIAACSSQEQADVQSPEDNQGSSASSVQPEPVIEKEASVQYVYSSDTVTFTEYGDKVDVCDVACKGNQVYILMEVKNWDEAAGDEPSEVFYQVMSCLLDGSQRSVSDKIILQTETGDITEIHISDAGCVAALCQGYYGA